MNGYAKMKTKSDTKSRSMDFSSDLLSLSSSPLETQNPKLETSKTKLEQKQIKKNPFTTIAAAAVNSSNKTQDSFSFLEQEKEKEEDHQGFNINYYYNNYNNNGENFGVRTLKLKRNSTVSASSVTSHAFQSAVKRAFSMRRSSYVSERYRRIHDQSVTLASPIEDEDIAVKMKKSSKSKIIKACKKLFGL